MERSMFLGRIWFYIIDHWSDILVLAGFAYYFSARVLGILPLTRGRKQLLDDLLSFLNEQLGGQGEVYRFPEELLKELEEQPEDPVVLTKAAKDILAHCQAKAPDLQVRMEHEDLNSAGVFYKNEITINQTLHMRKTEMLAVLIHECMHYFLLVAKEIRLEDTRQNEYLTDIAALYMGFGEYMNRGYLKVGYLKRNEIRYVRKRLGEVQSGL